MQKHTKIHIFIFLIGFISTAILSGCSMGGKWNDIEFYEVEKVEQATEVPKRGTEENEELVELRDSDDRTFDVKVDMQFMKSENDENENVCNLINEQLISLVLGQPKGIGEDEAIENYIAGKKNEFQMDDIMPTMHDYITGRAEYGKKNIITYRVVEDIYTGGAHPLCVTSIFTFDALTGEYLDLEKVFPSVHHEALTEMLLKKLMEQCDAEDIDALHEMGLLDMIDMYVSTNFALRADSVEFYYNPYDIAPYAFGPSTLCLDYESIKPYCARKLE